MRVYASMTALAPLRRFVRATPRIALALTVVGGLGACLDLNPNTNACSVTIAPATLSVPVNGAVGVSASAFDCDGNSIANKTINFSSANTAIATVTSSGQVIGVSVGSTTISAVANGKSGTAQVTVTPELANSVTLSPATITLRVGNTRQFTATAKNATGTVITGRTFAWSSSNSAIATVDQSGNVTALSPGNVVIASQVDNVFGNSSVTVTPIPIGQCTLTPGSQTITVTQQVQPTIALKDTAGNAIPTLGRPINWSSSNEVVATVGSTGLILARKAGTSIITAASVEYPNISCQATLNAVDPRIVTAQITPQTATLRIGVPRQLGVTLLDSVGGTIPPGRVITWASVTPALATVNATGLVTGVSVGAARIAVRAENAVDTVTYNVTKVPVTIVRVSPLTSSIVQGQTVQLNATTEDSTGAVVTDRAVTWSSGDVTKATVSGTGLVTAISPGNITITATSENRTGNASVTVQQVPVDTIEVLGNYSVALNVSNKSFAITLKDANGNQLFGRTVSITSSAPAVATGNPNQNATQITVTAFAAGSTVMTLRAINQNGQPEGRATQVTVTITP